MIFLSKLLLSLSAFFVFLHADTAFSKDYYKQHISKQKKYFFKFFSEKIELENRKILEERAFVKSLTKKKKLDKNSKEYKRLQKLQVKYKIKKIYDYPKLLRRIDIIPPSMALAQAATESGWGKSRFFKEANNIFGHWTFNPKIGIKPLRRATGKKHFIRIFPTLQDSIAAYMLNLNRTAAYYDFRVKRKEQRDSNNFINGLSLSSTMHKYSGIGHNYTDILKSIIKKNKLVTFDKLFHDTIQKEEKIKLENLEKQKQIKEKSEIHSPIKI